MKTFSYLCNANENKQIKLKYIMNNLALLTEGSLIDMFLAFRSNGINVSLCDVDCDDDTRANVQKYWHGMALLRAYHKEDITNEVLCSVCLSKGGYLYIKSNEDTSSKVITFDDVKHALHLMKNEKIYQDDYVLLRNGSFSDKEIGILYSLICKYALS
jgi:hypothetical protein